MSEPSKRPPMLDYEAKPRESVLRLVLWGIAALLVSGYGFISLAREFLPRLLGIWP